MVAALFIPSKENAMRYFDLTGEEIYYEDTEEIWWEDDQYDQDDARAAEEELSYLENFDWTDDEYEDEIDY